MERYKRKDNSPLMRLIAFVLRPIVPRFQERFWTTIGRTIYYPTGVYDPLSPVHTRARNHELMHVEQFRTAGCGVPWIGVLVLAPLYLLLPLPVLFSGRWFMEREPWLMDIRAGVSVERAVQVLWSSYAFPWPRFLMRRWFNKRLEGYKWEKQDAD